MTDNNDISNEEKQVERCLQLLQRNRERLALGCVQACKGNLQDAEDLLQDIFCSVWCGAWRSLVRGRPVSLHWSRKRRCNRNEEKERCTDRDRTVRNDNLQIPPCPPAPRRRT